MNSQQARPDARVAVEGCDRQGLRRRRYRRHRTSDARYRGPLCLVRSLKVSSLRNGHAKGCGIYHLALVLKPRNLVEHRSDQLPSLSALRGLATTGAAAASHSAARSELSPFVSSSCSKASSTSRIKTWNALNKARSFTGMASRILCCPAILHARNLSAELVLLQTEKLELLTLHVNLLALKVD